MALELVRKRKRLIQVEQEEKPQLVYAEERAIVGPLGIWPYPIINVLLQIIERLRSLTVRPVQAYLPKTATRRTEYIRDSQGRIIEKLEEISVD
jgi:hypothetical protein